MPPRAPVVWTTTPKRGERILRKLDERHRDLTRDARRRGDRYRGARAAATDPETLRLRGEFLAALGRLAAFEDASLSLGRCRYDLQVVAYADDLARGSGSTSRVAEPSRAPTTRAPPSGWTASPSSSAASRGWPTL